MELILQAFAKLVKIESLSVIKCVVTGSLYGTVKLQEVSNFVVTLWAIY